MKVRSSTLCQQCDSNVVRVMVCRYCKLKLCSDCYNNYHPCTRTDIDVEESMDRQFRFRRGTGGTDGR